MSIVPVPQLGDPSIRERSVPVSDPTAPHIRALVTDLADTLLHWRTTTTYGRGIAAPQINVPLRAIFLNVDRPWPLINPAVVERSAETMIVWDACLCFLDIFCQVVRHRWIRVRYQDLEGIWHEIRAEGDLSELLQHEIDHLNGVLAVDRITNLQTLCTRNEFERRYRDNSPYAPASADAASQETQHA